MEISDHPFTINNIKKTCIKINKNFKKIIHSKSNYDLNDKDNKENINNNNNYLDINKKNHININIDYLKELNMKDLRKIKCIKQKLLDNSINKIILINDIEKNEKSKKKKINNNRNKISLFKKNVNKSLKYFHSFNTPRKIKENKNKSKLLHGFSSFNQSKGTKSENIIKSNQIPNYSVNDFIISEEQNDFINYQGKKVLSHNNSFLNNSNERNKNYCSDFNNYKSRNYHKNREKKNQSQLISDSQCNSFFNRFEH